ncbi:MAG: DUF1624 domain-containing protein [Oscillospiraceae bacterium]|jgi:uncharacterized membrane protein|nr:DUF1624 domain-containing protein [Oscillospiraceae bacterium]
MQTRAGAEQIKPKNRRITLLDELRGLAVILMLIYHVLYDLTYFFRLPIPLNAPYVAAFQFFSGSLFILVAGMSCVYSKRNARRGGIYLLIAIGITVVTYFIKMPILFGIIHFIAVCKLLYAVIGRIVERGSGWAGLIIFGALFIGFAAYYYSQMNRVLNIPFPPLPKSFYKQNVLLFLIGNGSYGSADYYPIFPWVFVFLTGAYAGKIIRDKNADGHLYSGGKFRALAFAGRHSLSIYALHQPIILLILFVIFQIRVFI